VMKKMLPDEDGTSLPQLVGGQQQTYTLTYEFQGSYVLPPNANFPVNHATEHTVEEFSDLGIAAWIYDVNTFEVYQSTTGTIAVGIDEDNRLFVNGKVYPNPVVDMANIVFNLSEPSEDVITRVFDSTGKLAYQENHGQFIAGRNQLLLNTDGLEKGLYFIQLISGNQQLILDMNVQ